MSDFLGSLFLEANISYSLLIVFFLLFFFLLLPQYFASLVAIDRYLCFIWRFNLFLKKHQEFVAFFESDFLHALRVLSMNPFLFDFYVNAKMTFKTYARCIGYWSYLWQTYRFFLTRRFSDSAFIVCQLMRWYRWVFVGRIEKRYLKRVSRYFSQERN